MQEPGITPDFQIDRSTLQEWLAARKPIEILDIRRRADYEDWRIPGALNMDVYDSLHAGDPGSLAEYSPNTDTPIVLACYVGQTSQIAAAYLRARGVQAYSLEDGMLGWSLAWHMASHSLAGLEVVQLRRVGKGCLSYLLVADGQGLIVDASLEPAVFLGLADRMDVKVIGVLDTHIHADHLSRGPWLAASLNAPYYLPENQTATLPHTPLKDGEFIEIGSASLLVRATPGHTLESICLIYADQAVFTGDTLFTASFGRPDLSGDPSQAWTNAQALHRSLLALRSMPGNALAFPAHTEIPVGFEEPVVAAALDAIFARVRLEVEAGDFAARVTTGLPEPPANHVQIHKMNAAGQMPSFALSQIEAGPNRCAVRQESA
jgi:glyoxylase-like metal-dependent hydrolase (beta-lactamase superfamily II)